MKIIEANAVEIANAIASGRHVDGARLLFDDTDPNNTGAYVRFDDGEHNADTPVEFDRMAGPNAASCDVHFGEWFGGDGQYQRPDQDGVYPVFA